jgi:hypothetical protein
VLPLAERSKQSYEHILPYIFLSAKEN